MKNTIEYQENDIDRLGLKPNVRLIMMGGLACTYGMFHGVTRGARLASLRYLAENAHRLPRTRGTWYFFHKRKNYVILKDSINRGVVTSLKYGAATTLFFGLEIWIDNMRHQLSWISTTGAAFGCGLLISGYQRLPMRQLLRSVRNFTLFGAVAGIVQDAVRHKSQQSRIERMQRAEEAAAALAEKEKQEETSEEGHPNEQL